MTAPAQLPVALLAGGLATRLRPITEKVPKLLIEVAGEPFFSHQIRLLKKAGLTRIVLCVGYLGEKIVELYGDGSAWGVEIQYSFDGPKLLGTGGALIQALPKLGDAFYVLYGDSFLPIDYLAVGSHFQKSGRLGLMTVFENHERYDASNVEFADGEIKVYDKKNKTPAMHHIDYGLGLFRAAAFDGFPRDAVVDLAAVQGALVARRQLVGYEIGERFYEIGSHEGLKELDTLLRAGKFSEFLPPLALLIPGRTKTRARQPSSFPLRSKPTKPMSYAIQHLKETAEIVAKLDPVAIEKGAQELVGVRNRGGRLFILGVGGSAANASHAVNDFRKIAGLEVYAPTDNVSELTARTNDDGWASVFVEWLRGSRLNAKDALLILSVGGGNLEKNVSPGFISAIQLAKQVGARVIGIVGKDGGYTATQADACVIIPTVNPNNITPHSEAFQAVVWHLWVSHPDVKVNQTKWESVVAAPTR